MSQANSQRNPYDPNPGVGQVPLFDKIRVCFAPLGIPWALGRFAVRRISSIGRNDVSLFQDLGVSIMRGMFPFLPLSVMRALEQTNASTILDSLRFKDSNLNLYEFVRTPDFSGLWICQSAPGKLVSPAACDKVIYYIHGGGYQSGNPASMMTTLLRVAEIAAEHHVSISVFALDYSLAPEARFPIPINQGVAGYEYLLHEMGVDASKIAILGDSAGGHLGLCITQALHEKNLPRPEAGVFLVSPWIDLFCSSGGSYVRNKDKDFIQGPYLATAGKTILASRTKESYSHLANFNNPRRGKASWKESLPARVWMSAGGHEVFHDEIVRFADVLRKEGVKTDLDVTEKKLHVWQTISDRFDEKKYLNTPGPSCPGDIMVGAANLARAILS